MCDWVASCLFKALSFAISFAISFSGRFDLPQPIREAAKAPPRAGIFWVRRVLSLFTRRHDAAHVCVALGGLVSGPLSFVVQVLFHAHRRAVRVGRGEIEFVG